MEKKTIDINLSNFKENESIVVTMNKYYVYEIKNFNINKEIMPGIYVKYNTFLKFFFKKLEIDICNYRDSIKIEIVTKYKKELIYYHEGSRHIKTLQCTDDEFVNKIIKLDSIHYATRDLGGDGERCILKEFMKKNKLYPEHKQTLHFDRTEENYQLFEYEEIFYLPEEIEELKRMCRIFCTKRNNEIDKYSLEKGGKEAINRLINEHYSGAVRLIRNNDKTIEIDNGRHRICFLKHFAKEYSIYSISVKHLSESHLNYDKNKCVSTQSYYKKLEELNVSRKEAEEFLLNGINSVELFKEIVKRSIKMQSELMKHEKQ